MKIDVNERFNVSAIGNITNIDDNKLFCNFRTDNRNKGTMGSNITLETTETMGNTERY